MARITDDKLDRLKYEIALERLVTARGVVLRKRGDELIGLCPFHEDHSPSLVVNPAKNLWNCLGACQAGGTVIDWVMKAEGVSFRHAVELLRNDYTPAGVTSAISQQVSKISTVTKLKSVVSTDGDTQERLRQVLNYYTETLKQSPEALEYMAKRGIDHGDAIELFRLGYSNRTLGYHIPLKNRRDGASIRGQLEDLGIYRKSGHEHFSGSLVIPVFDDQGIAREVYGRKIKRVSRKGSSPHLYLPGPHRGVWNEAAFKASSEVILCESLIDALTFWCAGYRNVTAAYGINGFTEEHLTAFQEYGIERVLIAYDRDEAGESAALSLGERLMAEGIECFRILFPKGMDANEYALSVKPAEKSLGLVIRKAVWMGKGRAPSITTATTTSSVGAVREPPGEITTATTPPMPPPATSSSAESSERKSPFEKGGLGDFDTSASAPGKTKSPRPPLRKGEEEASPLPTPTPSQIHADIKAGEVVIQLGDRRWRIRGLEKNMSFDSLRVNVLCARGDAFHVDTFDLYAARHRQTFLKQAAEELSINEDVLKKDLGKILLKLEELQEKQITQTLNPDKDKGVALSEADRSSAMALLKDPKLLDRILADFEKCGIVGEETNKLVGYLAAVSRKLEEPLAVVLQSSSAAGKSSLMEAILSFFPHEEQVKYSAMTGQSLFYMGETDLQHKILAIVEEEGAERAAYALKLLQSEGELTIASTGKDPSTGRLVTQEYRVEGPVMIFLTTTAIEIDEELQNRCIVLTVDEDREQTRAIHKLQRERQTLAGLLARRDSDELKKLHQDAQRLLRPLLVANPYAEQLTFLDDRTRTRRDHMKYLTLIRSIALLHQYQRPLKYVQRRKSPRPPLRKGEACNSPFEKGGQGDFDTNPRRLAYIEVTLEDIEITNRLAHQVLGRSLDELAPQTRRLLMQLDQMVTKRSKALAMARSDYRFTRREVREHTGFGNTQLKIHMHRLEELEYLIVHRGGRGQQFVYELAYQGQGQDGEAFMMGLMDVSDKTHLRNGGTMETGRGLSSTGRGQVGPKSGGCRGVDRPVFQNDSEEIAPINGKTPQITSREASKKPPYLGDRSDSLSPLVADASEAS
ncbi:MAG: CHC2 zinc finger domain-containing protein [Myxococcota bacterium]|nr:CHC2 zinc finger domain-containing protein [Myxococcota bacterium]